MHNYTIYIFFLYKCMFIVNYLLQYVLMKFWCKLLENDMIYLSTAIGLTPGGSGTVHTINT